MGQQVLGEEAQHNLPADSPETPESWTQAFTGVKQTLNDYSQEVSDGNLKSKQIEKMWDFFQESQALLPESISLLPGWPPPSSP